VIIRSNDLQLSVLLTLRTPAIAFSHSAISNDGELMETAQDNDEAGAPASTKQSTNRQLSSLHFRFRGLSRATNTSSASITGNTPPTAATAAAPAPQQAIDAALTGRSTLSIDTGGASSPTRQRRAHESPDQFNHRQNSSLLQYESFAALTHLPNVTCHALTVLTLDEVRQILTQTLTHTSPKHHRTGSKSRNSTDVGVELLTDNNSDKSKTSVSAVTVELVSFVNKVSAGQFLIDHFLFMLLNLRCRFLR
jgi:hypothetical protein